MIALFGALSCSTVNAAPQPAGAVKLPIDPLEYPYGSTDISVVKSTGTEACDASNNCRGSFQVYLAVKNKSYRKQ
ncbi:hypothetical protein HDV05_008634, partial [Chytridiales sp. JEL 0842]